MYHGGFLWSEITTMPVAYKRWFMERIHKELTKGGEAGTQSKAPTHNGPDVRALQNKTRSEVPSRLRRFT